MRTAHDDVMDDLAALVAGDAAAIARHADHLASCDACRDAKHDAAQLAAKLGDAGADYAPPADLVERVMAKIDSAGEHAGVDAKTEAPTSAPDAMPVSAPGCWRASCSPGARSATRRRPGSPRTRTARPGATSAPPRGDRAAARTRSCRPAPPSAGARGGAARGSAARGNTRARRRPGAPASARAAPPSRSPAVRAAAGS